MQTKLITYSSKEGESAFHHLGLREASFDMAKVYSKSTGHSTIQQSSGAGHMNSTKLGDERFKAQPQATTSVRVDCFHRSRINGPSVAMAWKRYFCFLTKVKVHGENLTNWSPLFASGCSLGWNLILIASLLYNDAQS